MLLVLALVIGGLALNYLPRVMVNIVATAMAIHLLRRSRSVSQKLIRAGAEHRDTLDFDRRPSRSQRRLMRAHLTLAVKQTELASLLPTVMTRVRSVVDGR